MNDCMFNLYGNYRTRTFSNIFPAVLSFTNFLKQDCGIDIELSPATLSNLYYLLYARYGNSSIASSDENQFKYKVAAIIFQYGPTWERKLAIQKELRTLTPEELSEAAHSISNHAYNPSSDPQTDTLAALPYINEQNVNGKKRSKIEYLSLLETLLDTDVTGEFLSKFKPLFLSVVMPEKPLWYVTEEDN